MAEISVTQRGRDVLIAQPTLSLDSNRAIYSPALHVFGFDGLSLYTAGQVRLNSPVARVSIAIGVEDQIVVIYGGMVEFLESLILTKSGELHNRHYIAGRGDYPIVATTGSRTFACWVGSPASPIEYQDRARKEAQTDAWVSHYLSQLEDKDDNRRELIPLVRQSGSAVQNHHTPTLRDFMHGLWLGEIDSVGQCIAIQTPVGIPDERNVLPSMSFRGDEGIVAWSSSLPEDKGPLYADG